MTRSKALLQHAGLEANVNRTLVLDAVLEAQTALTPAQLLDTLGPAMNKVTLYRILELLVEHRIIERHSGPDRAFHYCAGQGHGHFHCTRCGRMHCLTLPESTEALTSLTSSPLGRVDTVEVRLDGVCQNCLKA
ncbi:MAG: transcriptional repressor [Proteobacteria bacterium]|nr:transcriptional repressor [Pseudomonadota bacterium]MBU1610516.1 transcriptional repressor [Pseudomonadota bacterium]